MSVFEKISQMMVGVIQSVYGFLWGDLIRIPLPGGSTLGISLLVLILIPSGIYFTLRTRFLPFRLFPEMLKIVKEKRNQDHKDAISGVQALIVSTATRVGMGNLVGVVAAISVGGAGAVFWMWVRLLPLWRRPWLRFIKKKILFTEATGEARLIIYTTFFSGRAAGGNAPCWQFSLPSQA